ncbi:hypothetical protein ACHAW6_014313 [Cyclotella cf. meneghiniana]
MSECIWSFCDGEADLPRSVPVLLICLSRAYLFESPPRSSPRQECKCKSRSKLAMSKNLRDRSEEHDFLGATKPSTLQDDGTTGE